MNSRFKIWIYIPPLLIFVGLIAMLYLRQMNVERDGTNNIINRTSVSRAVPSFKLPLLADPNRLMTNADLPKVPYVLNVWGSWCISCRAEHPLLLAMKAQGVPIVGINYRDDLAEAIAYLNEHQDPFLYSVQDIKGEMALDLGLTGAPESFVIDQDGKIRLHIAGIITEANFQGQIKPCLDALINQSLDDVAKNQACEVR